MGEYIIVWVPVTLLILAALFIAGMAALAQGMSDSHGASAAPLSPEDAVAVDRLVQRIEADVRQEAKAGERFASDPCPETLWARYRS